MDLFTPASELLYTGHHVEGMELKPEAPPLFLTTAFTMDSFDEVRDVYDRGGYTYIRGGNPNRDMLAETISYLEGGEKTHICASGMGAIASSLYTVLDPFDRIVCNKSCYGEAYELMTLLLSKMQIETDFVDFTDLDAVREAITPATALLYTEVFSNPTLAMADIEALAALAHENGALLMVDNTFTTPLTVTPLELGANLVVNSLTKFLNGHSDAIGGSVTAKAPLIEEILKVSMLLGNPGDPFSSWLIHRGAQTAELRIRRQMENANRLAAALEADSRVEHVNHPSLPGYPQRELADRLFPDGLFTPMLSFILPEDPGLLDRFLRGLHFARYAPTLGGIRTTLSHPVTSSHPHVPDQLRREMGITPGMFRVSCGIEDPDDLIRDFLQALDGMKG